MNLSHLSCKSLGGCGPQHGAHSQELSFPKDPRDPRDYAARNTIGLLQGESRSPRCKIFKSRHAGVRQSRLWMAYFRARREPGRPYEETVVFWHCWQWVLILMVILRQRRLFRSPFPSLLHRCPWSDLLRIFSQPPVDVSSQIVNWRVLVWRRHHIAFRVWTKFRRPHEFAKIDRKLRPSLFLYMIK